MDFYYFYYRVVRLRWLVCKSCLSVVNVFSERGLKCSCFSPGVIPDESKAMSLLAPANAVAGMMPGGGLLPTPNPLASVSFFFFKSSEFIFNLVLQSILNVFVQHFRWEGHHLEA